MIDRTKIIVCDKCKNEFAYQSIHIKESSIEVLGKVLLLDYFTCPFCNAVYKVLFVEESKYRELVDDLVRIEMRIANQRGKGNPMLIDKLQNMAMAKRNRINVYIESMNKKYPGSFMVLATENNQMGEYVIYLPREYAE